VGGRILIHVLWRVPPSRDAGIVSRLFFGERALENSKEHLTREVLRSSSPESEYPAAKRLDIAEAFVKSKAANEISSLRIDK